MTSPYDPEAIAFAMAGGVVGTLAALREENARLRQRVEELERETRKPKQSCGERCERGHDGYWRTLYDNCMACKAEAAEAKLAEAEANLKFKQIDYAAFARMKAEVARLREALTECIAKRRGDAGPIAAQMADARVLDEEVRDYIARADTAARAALAPAQPEELS